jgi:hypothetical protein
MALGEHDEDVEEMLAVFGGGGQVAADRAELPGTGERAQASGTFCRSLIMRMSRSEPLLSGGIRQSRAKRR